MQLEHTTGDFIPSWKCVACSFFSKTLNKQDPLPVTREKIDPSKFSKYVINDLNSIYVYDLVYLHGTSGNSSLTRAK